ncbi:FKBP-type peptidyl-prolyl cis-trans isomerase [Simiduia aestuariiviva]|uniref:Peptidyl-prolyl cis-trans isomerase n=1 Tax=Simiduia aestuariiviva TaxID=1510459 RepID=A0A839UUL0_9GAMM|nr:FKBP-type peptidyl-prolyl cis-trans isomerase [Simiduia aestuariiviva]MBB3170119.1 FKBP-type peptidyl-prolyl cis-trans isomerase SlpA [Simiduia aestuariiviva]
MSKLVTEGAKLAIHFALKLRDGSVVDSNFEGEPAEFCLGDGNLLPGFERCLLGMAQGQRETFVVSPEQGFGQANPNNIQVMPRSTFAPDMNLAEGLVVSFADAQKAELPGVIKAFNDTEVTVDFNHPLAGQEILFDVEVVRLEVA